MTYVPRPNPGDRVKVKAMPTAYSLPLGLKDGDEVTCIEFDHSFWTVEMNGQTFEVFRGCLDIKLQPWPPQKLQKK
jgi:hypothetical protein